MRAKFPKRVCCYFDFFAQAGLLFFSIVNVHVYVHVCMHMYTCMCMLCIHVWYW